MVSRLQNLLRHQKIDDVPKNAFDPKPRIDSVLIAITKRKSILSRTESIIKEFILQDDKKVKKALLYAFKRIDGVSKTSAKEKVSSLNIIPHVLEKKVDAISNKQFNAICRCCKNI